MRTAGNNSCPIPNNLRANNLIPQLLRKRSGEKYPAYDANRDGISRGELGARNERVDLTECSA